MAREYSDRGGEHPFDTLIWRAPRGVEQLRRSVVIASEGGALTKRQALALIAQLMVLQERVAEVQALVAELRPILERLGGSGGLTAARLGVAAGKHAAALPLWRQSPPRGAGPGCRRRGRRLAPPAADPDRRDDDL